MAKKNFSQLELRILEQLLLEADFDNMDVDDEHPLTGLVRLDEKILKLSLVDDDGGNDEDDNGENCNNPNVKYIRDYFLNRIEKMIE